MAGSAQALYASVHEVGDFDFVDAPPGVQPGDILLMWVSVIGSVEDVDVSGGAPWTAYAENTSTYQVRMFVQVAGSSNPSRYRVRLAPGDWALVGLLHLRGASLQGLVVTSDDGGFRGGSVPCPPADPGVAGGVEVRVALAYNPSQPLSFITGGWPVGARGSDGFDSIFIGARTLLSDADLPTQTIPTSTSVTGWQAWTVIVAPADTTPPPPPAPAYVVAGSALYRYTVHDFLTGAYIDDIYPRDVEYTKKIREPGTFTGTLPIPNAKVAAAVRRIIPQTRSDLTTGPGRVEIRVWRDGELWGRYWLTGARLQRGRDGKISIELRGSTLDAYWYSLIIQHTLDGQDDEQISSARTFLSHGLDQADADLGIVFQPGSSGVVRPYLAKPEDNTSYGRSIEEFSKSENGFEYFLAESVTEDGVRSTWRWASPKFNTGVKHVVTSTPHGGNIAEYGVDIDALRGGTYWRARGGTLQLDPEEDGFALLSDPVITPHRAAGWPRIDHIVDHPTQSLDPDELDDLAEYSADIAGGALWVRTVTIYLPRKTTLNMNSLGDELRMLITDVWHPSVDGAAGLDISERILEIRIRPPARGRGVEEATLTLESVEVP